MNKPDALNTPENVAHFTHVWSHQYGVEFPPAFVEKYLQFIDDMLNQSSPDTDAIKSWLADMVGGRAAGLGE